jgi:hypothetical protein
MSSDGLDSYRVDDDDPALPRRIAPSVATIRRTLWSTGIVGAALQAWAFRRVVNPDGISYLDMGQGLRMATGTPCGLRIVAEVPLRGGPSFWEAPRATQTRVFEAFAVAGASVVITKDRPPAGSRQGWEEIEQTGYYVYALPARPEMAVHGNR